MSTSDSGTATAGAAATGAATAGGAATGAATAATLVFFWIRVAIVTLRCFLIIYMLFIFK